LTILTAAGAVGLAAYRDAVVRAAPLLPVAFLHDDHTSVGCIACHHNFVDSTGTGSCYACHKFDPELALSMQSMFHGLCRDCHREQVEAGRNTGPMRRCSTCHVSGGIPAVSGSEPHLRPARPFRRPDSQ
jgi:hypothetical protein